MLPKWISDATVDDLDELKETIEMLYVAGVFSYGDCQLSYRCTTQPTEIE